MPSMLQQSRVKNQRMVQLAYQLSAKLTEGNSGILATPGSAGEWCSACNTGLL